MKFQGPSPSRIYNNILNNNPTDPCIFGIFLDNNGFVGPILFPTILGLPAPAENIFGDFMIGPPNKGRTRTKIKWTISPKKCLMN
jgi:hypothetical protein